MKDSGCSGRNKNPSSGNLTLQTYSRLRVNFWQIKYSCTAQRIHRGRHELSRFVHLRVIYLGNSIAGWQNKQNSHV